MKGDYVSGIDASYNNIEDVEYKYIHFIKKVSKPKTSVWTCQNLRSGIVLGTIKWHGAWRQYCFFSVTQAIYSAGCCDDIADFIRRAMEEKV